MPFMERTLSMRNGGSNFFMGDQVIIYSDGVFKFSGSFYIMQFVTL